jgi:lipopolysaccharide transport system permease protein
MAKTKHFHIFSFNIVKTLLQHRYLLGQLIKRDVLLRYRGAYFGLLWVFLNPLILLGIFSFVLSHIFQARWSVQTGSIPFVLNLYCGLIAFNILSEAIGRAPTAVRSYPNYVKKIIFPVEILPIVPLGGALIHAFFNSMILVGALAWTGNLNYSILFFPILLFPLLMFSLGVSWFLAAWGVFIKDMSQIVPVFVQMLMFLSPVFYPVDAVPEFLRPVYVLNPLSSIIEVLRASISASVIDWVSWGITLAFSIVVLVLGYAFFQRSRDEFADVL